MSPLTVVVVLHVYYGIPSTLGCEIENLASPLIQNCHYKLAVEACSCHPDTQAAEAERVKRVQGEPQLQSQICLRNARIK